MDNLKKNLHFVVFGGGVLLGIILLFVGITVRGGKEESLSTAQANLAKYSSVKSKGTLERATKRASGFGGTLEEAENALSKGKSVAFNSDYTTHPSGGAFYSAEANAKLNELKARFAAMEKPQPMPKLLEHYSFVQTGNSGSSAFWTQLEKDMSSPPNEKIRHYQMRLRIMDEFATTCERLLETGAEGALGVALISMKFDEYSPSGNSPLDSPWMNMPFQVVMESAPSFAVLLSNELVNPTKRSLGKTADGKERIGFPIFLDMLQTEMKERPLLVRFDIGNDEKAEVAKKVNEELGAGEKINVPSDPKALDPKEGEGKKLVEEATKILNESDVIELPVRVGMRLRAGSFNKDWKVVAAPPEE
ncbi:MAG: hypothetical protein KDB68_01405 [Planctomycetes bacterium]|nr:hypothetical protein [Planctomycetota bacterium]MCA8934836.1 hypothetical protein [Planctomycetota bacterium]MCA8947363.1 hypothetical protein [Planctomycetota bacterium]